MQPPRSTLATTRPSGADGDRVGAVEEGTQHVATSRLEAGRLSSGRDSVVREEPLEIQLDGTSLAVVMRTPGRDRELGLGFLVTERVVSSASELSSIHHSSVASDPEAAGNVLRVNLRSGHSVDIEALRRNLYASSSCGICGKATIEQALHSAPPLRDPVRFEPDFFPSLPTRLRREQALFAETGGLHAAALFTPDGELRVVREDVGRHNAVDKVIGWALERELLPLQGHVLLVSGRISYEIAQKALAARIPVVAAVSAPSSLAVALADAANQTLVGFLRNGGFNVYANRRRILG
jgi:FdhD protein